MFVPEKIISKFPKLTSSLLEKNLSLPSGKNKMILDTDTANEIDDQFALAWTLLSPDKIDLLGVTAEPYSFQHHREELIEAYNIIVNKQNIDNTNKELISNYSGWVNGLIESNINPKDIYFDTPEEGVEKSYQEIITIFNKLNIKHEGMVFRGSPKYLENYNEPIVTESSKFIVDMCKKYSNKSLKTNI